MHVFGAPVPCARRRFRRCRSGIRRPDVLIYPWLYERYFVMQWGRGER